MFKIDIAKLVNVECRLKEAVELFEKISYD